MFPLSGDPGQSAVHEEQPAGRGAMQRGAAPPRRSRESPGVLQSSTAPAAAAAAGTGHQAAGVTAAGNINHTEEQQAEQVLDSFHRPVSWSHDCSQVCLTATCK